MIVASEAEEAWWPPTFRPSPLARRWFALWMVQVESHSTLRSSSARKGRRGSCVMRAGSRGRGPATLGQGPTPPQSRCAKLVRQACAVDPPPPSPYLPSTSERVAQPVEHLTFNQEVLGSSPSALTKYPREHKDLQAASRPVAQGWLLCSPCGRFRKAAERLRSDSGEPTMR